MSPVTENNGFSTSGFETFNNESQKEIKNVYTHGIHSDKSALP